MSMVELVHAIPGRMRVRLLHPSMTFDDDQTCRLQAWLLTQPGVQDVRINALCRSLVVHCDPQKVQPKQLVKLLKDEQLPCRLGKVRPAQQPMPGPQQNGGTTQGVNWKPLILSTAAAVLTLTGQSTLTPWLLASASAPIFRRAYRSLTERRRLNVDVLDAAGATILATQGQWLTGSLMTWLISLGDVLRDLTRQQSARAVRQLFDRQCTSGWVIRNGQRLQVPVGEILVGERVVVYPGEMIPVDGKVVKGVAAVDQHMLTGESMPVSKESGNSVYAGTVVCDGKLYIRTRRVGEQTKASQIAQLILSTPVGDTRMQSYAEHFADRLVPFHCLGAGGLLAATGNVNMAASLLIVDFATGIRVAAPTTVLASIAAGARQGMLIKGGRFLEKLARVDTIIFDKTGTLTTGRAEVIDVLTYGGFSAGEVLALAGSAEARLNHPAARAVVRAAHARGIRLPERHSSRYTVGMGMEARVNGSRVLVGNERFLKLHQVGINEAGHNLRRAREAAASALLVAVNGKLAGLLLYTDPLRPEAAAVVQALQQRGVERIILFSGDNAAVVQAISGSAGISRYVAHAFPEDKARLVETLQREGHVVAVVGDGVNDSPALAQADVGIAVSNGTDLARETANVLLLDESLWKIPQAIDRARDMMGLIQQNWRINSGLNVAAIALSLLGWVGPVGTILLSNGAAVLATLNGLRPLLRSPATGSDQGDESPLYGEFGEAARHDAGQFPRQLAAVAAAAG